MPFDAGSDEAVAVMHSNVISQQVSEMNMARKKQKAKSALSNVLQAVTTKSEMPVATEASPSPRHRGSFLPIMGANDLLISKFGRCSLSLRRGSSGRSPISRSHKQTTSRSEAEMARHPSDDGVDDERLNF